MAAVLPAQVDVEYEMPPPQGEGLCSTRHAWARVPTEPTSAERATGSGPRGDDPWR